MNMVFILYGVMNYDDRNVLGVFTSKMEAEEIVKSHSNWKSSYDWLEIEDVQLNTLMG